MKTAFKKTSELDGTHLVGYVETTFDELVKTFGEPHHTESDDGKITAEWGLEFPDGTIATIYDWKEEETPQGKYDWHIGGHSDYAAIAVRLALETCEKETAIMNKCSCANQNETAQEVAEYIAHIYFTKSEKIFNNLMEFIADGKFTGSYSRCADCKIQVSG